MENVKHWTQRSTADFVHNISSDFVAQLETKMEEENVSRSELASRLGKSGGRVSQVFNDPGNLSLRVIVDHARALGMKVSLLAYDDGDPANDNGPINPDVFVKCWEKADRPSDLFEVEASDNYLVAHFESFHFEPSSASVVVTGFADSGIVYKTYQGFNESFLTECKKTYGLLNPQPIRPTGPTTQAELFDLWPRQLRKSSIEGVPA